MILPFSYQRPRSEERDNATPALARAAAAQPSASPRGCFSFVTGELNAKPAALLCLLFCPSTLPFTRSGLALVLYLVPLLLFLFHVLRHCFSLFAFVGIVAECHRTVKYTLCN